ncbi:transposase [Xenorhabdus bovienii]|uniref:transposase n=1 Tax=Xenorhabdus bovienii TaxID=40576 RepID=UPI003DA35234
MISIYQYLNDYMADRREETVNYFFTLLEAPLDNDFPEEFMFFRKLYHEKSGEGKKYLNKTVIEITNKIILNHFEKLDKIRFLENGKDMFPLFFTPKKYNEGVFIPENMRFCEIIRELIQEEK